MFEPTRVLDIVNAHYRTLQELQRVHRELDRRFAGLEDATLALVLSAASGEPLLLVGPPGTAKSMLIRTFCELAGVDREGSGSRYFEYLLTPFTEPGELFGFYDPSKLTSEGRLERIHADAMMQSAHVVFLDEVFKGSSAILNALLSFMNERAFYDRGERHRVPMQCLFAATNELPDSDELHAIWDRFTLRCRVDNVAADRGRIQDMLAKAWPLTYSAETRAPAAKHLLNDLQALRDTIRGAAGVFDPGNDALGIVTQLVELARTHGLSQVSNRRMVKFVYVMLVHRVYDCVRTGETSAAAIALRPEDLRLLPAYFLDQETHEEGIRQLHAAIADWHAERSAVA
ncbi:MAG TPA: AAA family ATPase [Vicinamibacterales bacterium]|nr:AAA family ATPase [Vicinamibacterales bacterium]